MEIEIKTKTNKYQVLVEENALDDIYNHYDFNRKVLIITDDNIPLLYVNKVLNICHLGFVYTVLSGEQSKDISVYTDVLKYLMDNSFSRKDLIVGVGGGVIGDLSGFIASTYMRGIEYLTVPTTILSQVDSSIGGKTGLNFHGSKNMIGSFYPPSLVVIDSNTLKTLPKRQYYSGLVEALKCGYIFDKKIIPLFYDIDNNLQEIMLRALEVKRRIVEIDEYETSERKLLNFGHTIGHAIESYYDLNGLLHGEAIAYGMLKVLDKSLVNDYKKIIASMGINLDLDYDKSEVLNYIVNDKKYNSSYVDMIYVDEVGKGYLKKTSLEEINNMLSKEGEDE